MTEGTMEETLAVRAARLFCEYRDGDEAKMADLVQSLTPILWHTARAARLDAATAEDVLQNTWLTLVRKADTITEPLAVLQWLVVTTKREAWRVARVQAKVRPEDMEAGAATMVDPSEAVEDSVVRTDIDRPLWQHIESLPDRSPAQQRVIPVPARPAYLDRAKALGMPQGSIGPTRGRCLAKLRVALAHDPTWENR